MPCWIIALITLGGFLCLTLLCLWVSKQPWDSPPSFIWHTKKVDKGQEGFSLREGWEVFAIEGQTVHLRKYKELTALERKQWYKEHSDKRDYPFLLKLLTFLGG